MNVTKKKPGSSLKQFTTIKMARLQSNSIVSLKEVPFCRRTNEDKLATKQLGPPRPNLIIQQVSTKGGKSYTRGFSKKWYERKNNIATQLDEGYRLAVRRHNDEILEPIVAGPSFRMQKNNRAISYQSGEALRYIEKIEILLVFPENCPFRPQYACALSKYLLCNNSARKELAVKLQSLESNMSSGRKLFRFGNTVNSIDAAKQTLQLSDPVLRFCLTVANLNRSLYFICNNLLWARNVGLVYGMDKERWSLNASRCYFLSLVISLTRDIYVITQIMVQRTKDRRFQQDMDQHLNNSPNQANVIVPQPDAFLFLFIESLKSLPSVAIDTLKNI